MDTDYAKEVKEMITGVLTSNPLRCTITQLCKDFYNIIGYSIPFRQFGFRNVEEYLRSIPDIITVYQSGPRAEVAAVVSEKSAHIKDMINKQKKEPNKRKPNRNAHTWYGNQASSDSYRHIAPRHQNNPPKVEPQYIPPPVVANYNVAQASRPALAIANKIEKQISNSLCKDSSDLVEDEYKSRVPREIQNNLRKLIKQFRNGILCSDLNCQYRKLYGRSLHFEYNNYRCLMEMCLDLPEIFQHVNRDNDYLLFDATVPMPTEILQAETDEEDRERNEEIAVDDFNSQTVVPDDVCYLSYRIPRCFPEQIKSGQCFDIFVSEIYDLSKFWIVLSYGDLKDLMHNLGEFFKVNSNKYVMPKHIITLGMYCVTMYDGQFHRAVVINLLSKFEGQVRVLYIDYGTVGDVYESKLWYLPLQFAKIPSQAIRARLSNIQPETQQSLWSVEAMDRFRELVDASLVAEVNDIDFDKKILEVYIADISNEKRIFYINDRLVDEGLAIYLEQEQSPNLFSDPNCIPIVESLHLLPEFHEIEMGAAPNSEDLKYIIANNIPMHHYMPHHFKIADILDTPIDVEQVEKNIHKINYDLPAPRIIEKPFDWSIFPKAVTNLVGGISSRDNVSEYSLKKRCFNLAPPKIIEATKPEIKPLLVKFSNSVESSLTGSLSDLNITEVVEEIPKMEPTLTSTNPFLNLTENEFNRTKTKRKSTNPFLTDLEYEAQVSTVNNQSGEKEAEFVCSKCSSCKRGGSVASEGDSIPAEELQLETIGQRGQALPPRMGFDQWRAYCAPNPYNAPPMMAMPPLPPGSFFPLPNPPNHYMWDPRFLAGLYHSGMLPFPFPFFYDD